MIHAKKRSRKYIVNDNFCFDLLVVVVVFEELFLPKVFVENNSNY